jgi:hypothetical protein
MDLLAALQVQFVPMRVQLLLDELTTWLLPMTVLYVLLDPMAVAEP